MRSTASERAAALVIALLLAAGGARAQSRGGEPPVPRLGPRPTFGGSTADDIERIREGTQRPVARPGDDGFDAAIARQQRDRSRRELQALELRQQTFERTLTTPDRERLQPRLRELDALHDDARRRLRDLDAELARPEPDQERLRARREQLQRDIDRLELETRQLKSP